MTEPIDWRAHSASFDRVAALYDQYRPGYPAELVEEIITRSEIPRGGKILEIGCGTGKATALFAPKGYSILCIEPGKNLAAIAARNLRGWRVEFETTTFENWNARVGEFDLAISAQAFHWVAPEIGFPKSARAQTRWLARVVLEYVSRIGFRNHARP
jgi:SAM-dependent methyltransferase